VQESLEEINKRMDELAKIESDRIIAEKLATMTTPPPEPFHLIENFKNESYNDFIAALNDKRKFLYQERSASEQKRFNTERAKEKQMMEKQSQVDRANSKIDTKNYKPGPVRNTFYTSNI